MIAIGGWNEGSTKYSGMAKDKKKRQKFVNSTIDFLQKHNFDGIFKIIDANLPKKGGTLTIIIIFFRPWSWLGVPCQEGGISPGQEELHPACQGAQRGQHLKDPLC